MTVNISKPALNLREKLAELDKPSGIAGEAVLRADTVQEQRDLIGAGRKNLIINGAMQVSQRGDYTSATTVNGSYYQDRWSSFVTVVTATTQTITANQPNGLNGTSIKYTATSAATGYIGGRQLLEDYANLHGRQVTASAWVKSNMTEAGLYISDGTNAFYSGRHSGSGAWEKLTVTLTVPTGGSALGVYPITYDGSNTAHAIGDYIEFTQVQLELGSVATDFEHRSYGEELALCQRYFWRWDHDSGISNGVYASALYDTGNHRDTVTFPVTLRTSPTVTFLNGTGSCIVDYRSPSNIGFYGTSPFRWDDTTAGYIAADAEL